MGMVAPGPGSWVVRVESVPAVRVVPGVGICGWVAVGVLHLRVGPCELLLGRSLVEPGPDGVSVSCATSSSSYDRVVLQWDANPKWASIMLASRSLNLSGHRGCHRVRCSSWTEDVIRT